jgi:ABC-type uncharacterized transport system substrate-binding protein
MLKPALMKSVIFSLLWVLAMVANGAAMAQSIASKQVLFVNSYHQGLASSDDQVAGALAVLQPLGVKVTVHYMDTKRNGDEAFSQAAALKARDEIRRLKPDLVIASDDAAAKFLIEPHLKNGKLPVVFCGVNWDASVYGLPYSNATGVVEVEPFKSMLKILSRYAKGNRIGFIGADTLPERRNIDTHRKLLKVNYTNGYLTSNFDDFKKKFLELQKEVDMIITTSPVGIEGWDSAAAREFMESNASVPVGGSVEWVSRYTLLTISGILREQGTRAGNIAVRILRGEKPGNIPVEENTDGKLFINMKIANRLGIVFDSSLLRTAEVVR